jgi:ribulose-phosphate 3-epimerase
MFLNNKKKEIKISPSILSSDFSNLGKEIKDISAAGCDYIHIDVMDGAFVPNITIGPAVISSIRKYSDLPFDVHLMIKNPENHIQAFAESGADIITIHQESTPNFKQAISQIKKLNKKVGISIVPDTNEDVLDCVIDQVDLILIMTVNPGFGGQKFVSSQLDKISKVRKKISDSGRDIDLEVDGGINDETARLAINAGANVLVSGSYIFKNKDYGKAIKSLKS